MKKPYRFDEVSGQYFCRECGKAIKQRLVETKRRIPKLCYEHYMELKKSHQGKKQVS